MAEQEQSAEQIFGAALDLPPEQRSAYLVRACRESPELRTLVEQLLADYKRMGTFLDHAAVPNSATNPDTTLTPDSLGLPAGFSLGRYTILDPLGAGGMGAVYRARDQRLERDVAIKILSRGVLVDENARRRFRREALALAKLGHAHIAAIYDVGEHDGIDFIAMECVPGETLAATVRSGPLSIKDATSIALQIAQALEEAHEHGVIHRDLKPANVMITPRRQVKVLDFGIAKLLATHPNATASIDTTLLAGTPLYMSPEQAEGRAVDARTDLWSLGVLYAEILTGKNPFAASGTIAVLNRIVYDTPTPLHTLRPDPAPSVQPDTLPDAQRIVTRALQKDPSARFHTASEMAADLSTLLASFTATPVPRLSRRSRRSLFAIASAVLVLLIAAGLWLHHRSSAERWASEEALPQMQSLLSQNQPLAAFLLWQKAHSYTPSDHQLQRFADDNTSTISIASSPAHATVEVQDYATPNGQWYKLGVTPLNAARIPNGILRWKVSKPGYAEILAAPPTHANMSFDLDAAHRAPPGMVYAPGGPWNDFVGFVGLLGPYKVPPFYVDRHEVTNVDFQRFVDSGGYQNKRLWPAEFLQRNGNTTRKLSFDEAIALFRDTTGRPGPSTWIAGHFPEGQATLPVTGVSWFEAAAYAAFVGKSLPAISQWFQIAPQDLGNSVVPASNIGGQRGLAPVESFKGLGPLGTYDTAGNAREWIWNTVDEDRRFILGGAWNSPNYFYYEGDAVDPFDRSATNGFRCVRNLAPMPADALQPVHRVLRDFSHFKPATDSVFNAYKLLYDYPNVPFDTTPGGIVRETEDWREEKVTFNTGYRGERMSAYLFLPKHVRPPFQTVLFFPSARVLFLDGSDNGRQLGDLQFFDYILQSGRAVMYPIYQDTYERKVHFYMPGASQFIQITTDQYKDAARSLDYLATRPDIDSTRVAYLGVSMGAAQGVINAELMQNRLKTAVLLDGGYFLDPPVTGADQAEFATRLKIPVLMVNGRYDYVFAVEPAQNPLFNMLATPPADKRHVLLDTAHDVTNRRPELTHTVLDWLDKYLGRVSY
ncbi:MAG TPA: bifunctional serine/threonine-protein kinase/formylglycine-generating enzyme family protein [Acidobacteriaceae bacterium]|jgi:serine/threonine protein kinase/dienelactone hydrolase